MLDTEANNKIQQKWDIKGDWYQSTIEQYSTQGTLTCAIMTDMKNADRTIEVSCGPGKHSSLLASQFLKKGGVLVSCDYSMEMIKLV